MLVSIFEMRRIWQITLNGLLEVIKWSCNCIGLPCAARLHLALDGHVRSNVYIAI
jgi:hypothetical protein